MLIVTIHRKKGDRQVFIARIDATDFVPYRLRIQFAEGPIELLGRIHNKTNTIMFPMRELGPKFHIDFRTVQRSEWLVLESMSPEFITGLSF